MTPTSWNPTTEQIQQAKALLGPEVSRDRPALIMQVAGAIKAAVVEGVTQERERLTKQAKLEVNKVLVAVSETSIDAATMALAERKGVSTNDVAQLGWFACWRSFVALLDGIPASLTSPGEL